MGTVAEWTDGQRSCWTDGHLIANCEGYRVEADDGLVGYVEEVVQAPEGREPIALRVRAGSGRVEHVRVGDVVGVEPLAERIFVLRPAERTGGVRVRDVMSSPVRMVGVAASLQAAEALLSGYGISGLAVVDEAGALVGVVSESDLVRVAAGRAARRREAPPSSVAEVMGAPALTVAAEAPLEVARRLLVEHDVGRLVVVADGRLVGIVSRADVVRALASPAERGLASVGLGL